MKGDDNLPKKNKIDLQAEKIRDNMLKHLSNNQIVDDILKKKVDDYCSFYKTAERVKKEIKKINAYNSRANSTNCELKRNYGINDLIKINKEMDNILIQLGMLSNEPTKPLKPSKDDDDNDI